MRIINWTWFWYVVIGFILGGGVVYLGVLLKEKAIKFVWYELALTVLVAVTFLFMGQTFIASFQEGQPRAAWLSLLFLGLPIILMAIGTFRSVQARMAKSK